LELITENIDYFAVDRGGIDRKKKSLHARTMAKLLCQFCATSLQKQAIFGEMWQC
jgi:hypothetical protein